MYVVLGFWWVPFCSVSDFVNCAVFCFCFYGFNVLIWFWFCRSASNGRSCLYYSKYFFFPNFNLLMFISLRNLQMVMFCLVIFFEIAFYIVIIYFKANEWNFNSLMCFCWLVFIFLLMQQLDSMWKQCNIITSNSKYGTWVCQSVPFDLYLQLEISMWITNWICVQNIHLFVRAWFLRWYYASAACVDD